MADEPQAQAASETKTAAPVPGEGTSLDVGDLTVDQLDQAQTAGSKPAEAPIVGDGGKGQEGVKADDPPPAAKTEDPKPGDPPAKVEPDPAKGEVVESRTPEEIETAVTAAIEEVKTAGGDQAAQDAAAEVARQPVAKTEAPAKVEEPAKEPEAEKARRFRVKDPIAQAALDLYKVYEGTESPITLAEAERRVRGGDAPAKTEDVAVPDAAKIVSDLEAEVAEIETKIVGVDTEGELYNAEIAKLNIEHTKKVAALETAKRDLRDEQQRAQSAEDAASAQWKKNAQESRGRAAEMFPDVVKKDSPLGKAVDERVAAMQDESHPDHSLLYSASAAELITLKVAQELNIAPVSKKAAAPAKQPDKVVIPAKTPAPPPVSGAHSSAASAQTVTEDAKKQLDHLRTSDDVKLEDLDAVMGDKGKFRLARV